MKKVAATFTLIALLFGFALAQAPRDTYVAQVFGDPDTLDPVQSWDTASNLIIENVYEGLYGYVGDQVDEFEPKLATSYTVSPDGLSYTFTLRQGVKFHSGNDFTCQDVEYSLKRALVTHPADSAVELISEAMLGDLQNADGALEDDPTDARYTDYYARIDASVTCSDDYTAVINLAAPDLSFFAKLIFPAFFIIDSRWAIEHGQWDGTEATWREWVGVDLREHYLHDHMSGTGAYQLVEWLPGQRVVAKAFRGYWGGAPALENVLIENVEEQSSRILALKNGDADRINLGALSALTQLEGQPGVTNYNQDGGLGWVSTTISAVFLNQAANAEDNPLLGSGKLDGKGIPPDFFADVHMRKCVNYLFDRQAYIDGVQVGYGDTVTMALPPSYLGYDPEVPEYTLDFEKAEEECKAAWDGQVWENGFELTILYNTGNLGRQTVADILKSNLEYLNPKFKVDVRGVAWPDFLAQRDDHMMPIFVLGWAPDYADPDTFIHTFYASTGDFGSSIGFKDQQIDDLDAQARTEADPERRALLYSELARRAYELSPFVVLPVQRPMIHARSDLKGVYLNPMYSGDYLWKDLSK